MNRLKVLVFALVAVGLWAAHLTMTSPALASKAVDEASAPLLGAPTAVAQRLEQARSELQGAAVRLASNPILHVKPFGRQEPPTAERFNAVRSAAFEALSDASKTTAFLVVSNEYGAAMAQGSADPAPVPEGFDLKGATAAAGDGVLLELNGTPCLFFSVPVLTVGGGEVKPIGAVMIGGPLWGSFANVDQLADAVAKDLNLTGLGLWMKGKLVGGSGKKDVLDKAFKAAKPGQSAVVAQGAASSFGPFSLPMFVGAANVLEIAARRDIPGTPFEVVAIASARPFMETLASAQKTALFMLLGLLLAGLAFTALMAEGATAEDDEAPLPQKGVVVGTPLEAKTRAEKIEPLPGTLGGPPPPPAPSAPEASPDDFTFAPPPPARTEPTNPTVQAPVDGPAEDPFAIGAPGGPLIPPPMPRGGAPSPMSLADDDFENQRTTAYPAHKMPKMDVATDSHAALDPFAATNAQEPSSDGSGFNPDATRVAAVPPELLKSARRDAAGATTVQTPALNGPSAAAPKIQSIAPVGGGASDEETHFQETFRDFVATRLKCGEPNDGMTYDKFAAKLRKNKEQLVAKYNCKTVRFQVYVKDGKAALKATPVKE
jgi:hypothetical protein